MGLFSRREKSVDELKADIEKAKLKEQLAKQLSKNTSITSKNSGPTAKSPSSRGRRNSSPPKDTTVTPPTGDAALLDVPVPKPATDKRGLKKKWRYYFKSKKVVKAVMFNKNGTVTNYYIIPQNDQWVIDKAQYIYEPSVAYYDTVNKLYVCYYYEGIPLPITLYKDRDKITFDTIDSETFRKIQKMEYIKVLAESGQISKLLRATFMVALITLIVGAVMLAVYFVKEGILTGVM